MDIFQLISQEDFDDAPEDSEKAFVSLVAKAQRNLYEYTKDLDENHGWHLIDEARYGFMNITIGLARAYNIEPFASLDVPKVNGRDNSLDYRQYKADLDHYMTQLLVGNSIKSKKESVQIAPEVKDKIRNYIHGLKEAIDNSSLNDSKKSKLHEKLRDFEKELEKSRLSYLAVAKFSIFLLGIPGTMWASYDVVTKLTHNVIQAVADAKVTEDEDRSLPASEPRLALMPPRKKEDEKDGEGKTSDLEDEIPF